MWKNLIYLVLAVDRCEPDPNADSHVCLFSLSSHVERDAEVELGAETALDAGKSTNAAAISADVTQHPEALDSQPVTGMHLAPVQAPATAESDASSESTPTPAAHSTEPAAPEVPAEHATEATPAPEVPAEHAAKATEATPAAEAVHAENATEATPAVPADQHVTPAAEEAVHAENATEATPAVPADQHVTPAAEAVHAENATEATPAAPADQHVAEAAAGRTAPADDAERLTPWARTPKGIPPPHEQAFKAKAKENAAPGEALSLRPDGFVGFPKDNPKSLVKNALADRFAMAKSLGTSVRSSHAPDDSASQVDGVLQSMYKLGTLIKAMPHDTMRLHSSRSERPTPSPYAHAREFHPFGIWQKSDVEIPVA